MRRYASDNPFRWYSNNEIDQYIAKGEKIRTQIRQNDAVGISNVLRRTHTNWSMTRKWVQLVKNSSTANYRKEHKGFEFEDTGHHVPAHVSVPGQSKTLIPYCDITPGKPLIPYLPVTPKPRYIDDLSAEFASVISSLAQSRMDYEKEMSTRTERLQMLDDKFEETVNRMYEQVQRISNKADSFNSGGKDPREIEIDTENLALRNKIRRQEEMRNLAECVDEITEMGSARNQLRASLRNLDSETRGLSGRVDDMRDLHEQDEADEIISTMDPQEVGNAFDYEQLMAMVHARQRDSKAREAARKDDEEEIEELTTCRKPKHALIWSTHDRVTTRPKQALLRDELMSDTLANVLNKASLLSTGTSESRRINSRARYINVFKPRPDTADRELIVPPSKTELNIDFMAKTLAQKGKCHRRYDIDQEVETPKSNLNTNARKNYCEFGLTKKKEEYPSLSNRVRYANIRSRARITLLGY